jgi:hypothetical protein
VVSLQPGLRGADVLPTNAWGASVPVYEPGALDGTIDRMLLDEAARAEALARLQPLTVDGNAARRVADLVYAHAAKSPLQKENRAESRA